MALHKKQMKIRLSITIGQAEAVIRMAKAVHNYRPLFVGMFPLQHQREVAARGLTVIEERFEDAVEALEDELHERV